VANAQTPGEIAYNECHQRTRSLIERVIGRLKERFRCLREHLRVRSMAFACRIIRVCAALNNFCEGYNPLTATGDGGDDLALDRGVEEVQVDQVNVAERECVIDTFRARLNE